MIKFKLYNEGASVIFRILEQDLSVTMVEKRLKFKATNGFSIYSFREMQLCYELIYIVGYEDIDIDYKKYLSILECNSEEEAEDYVKRALFAFNEWKENNYFNIENKNKNTVDKIEINENGYYEF